MTSSTPRPVLLLDGETVDSLDTFEYRMMAAKDLREGMLLVDPDLGTPVYALDQRATKVVRNGVDVTWLVEDFEQGRHRLASFGAHVRVPVAVR